MTELAGQAPSIHAHAELAARTRALIESVLLTDVDPAEMAAAGEQIRLLSELLDRSRLSAPRGPAFDDDGNMSQAGSPVTGAGNPISPPIDVRLAADGTAISEFTLGPVYEGPPGLVHGGVSAMILDHVLGMAAHASGKPGMTAGLDLRFRRPTPHSVPLVARAWTDRIEGRKTFTEGTISTLDGTVTVAATGVFILPDWLGGRFMDREAG